MVLVLSLFACRADEAPDPGRVVARRLNRAEYDHTVRDLLGTTQRPSVDFPADDFSLGFDTIGEVLSVSPLHVELYEHAADSLLDELFGMGTLPSETWTFEAETDAVRHDLGNVWDVTGWVLWSNGAVEASVWVPLAGDYTVAVDAFGTQAGDEPVRMAIRVDGVDVPVEVTAEEAPERSALRVPLTAGSHTIGAAFLNEYKAPPDEDRNLIVDKLVVVGPLDLPRVRSAAYPTVIPCDPEDVGESACAAIVADTFGRRAFRRPLTATERA
ncbi:MAG: DUF1587 domain-containing protein, partial [Myxococcota bacterium]